VWGVPLPLGGFMADKYNPIYASKLSEDEFVELPPELKALYFYLASCLERLVSSIFKMGISKMAFHTKVDEKVRPHYKIRSGGCDQLLNNNNTKNKYGFQDGGSGVEG